MTLDELWLWGCGLHRSAKLEPPTRIHAQGGDRDDWGSAQAAAIRGLPFTRAFEHYVDGGLNRPVRSALATLRPPRSEPGSTHAQRAFHKAMYGVVAAVVRDGHADRAQVQRRLGLADHAFHAAATNGFLALKTALERTA